MVIHSTVKEEVGVRMLLFRQRVTGLHGRSCKFRIKKTWTLVGLGYFLFIGLKQFIFCLWASILLFVKWCDWIRSGMAHS